MKADKPTTKKAVCYVRVSTSEQASEGTSLDTQTDKCRAYAEKEGLAIVRVFREEGESAKVWQRPRLLDMLKFLQDNRGKVHVLIVYKLDRLSRNTDDQHAVMYKLSQAEVELRSATENFDGSAAGKFMRTVLWGVAQFDNEVRAERTRDGMLRRFREGYWPYNPPSGYTTGKDPHTGKPVPQPHRVFGPLVRRAAEMRAEGYPYPRIARWLRQQGFKTSLGKSPSAQSMWRILKNPFNYGTMRAFGEQVQGRHQPLYSYDLYLRIRVVDGERAVPNSQRSKHNPDFPLLHTLRCTECGMPLHGSSPRGKLGKRYPYYHHHNPQCALARSYRREEVHGAFLGMLDNLKPHPTHLKLFRAVVLDVAKTKATEQKKEAERFHHRLYELRQKRENLIELKLSDPNHELLSRDEYLKRKEVVEREIESAETERAKFVTAEADVNKFLDRCFAVITDPARNWASYQRVEDKAAFQEVLFPKGVTYDGEKCGTPEIAPILATFQGFPKTKSGVVAPRGFEPRF